MQLVQYLSRRFLLGSVAAFGIVIGGWLLLLWGLGALPSGGDFLVQTMLPSLLVLLAVVGCGLYHLRQGFRESNLPIQSELEDSRDHQFRRLTETLELVLWEAELWTWQFTYVTPHAETLLGYPVEDWYKEHFWLCRIAPDDRDWVIDRCRTACAARESLELEYRMVHKEGTIVWVHDFMVVPKSLSGNSFFRGCLVDITHRKQAEEALRESESRYRLLANSMEDVISLADGDGSLIYVSPSYFRQTGFTWQEVSTTSYQTRVHPDDWAVVEQARDQNRQGQQTRIEWRCRRQDGTYFWAETTANPISDETGQVTRIACCTRDITTQKFAAEALQQSEERFRSVVEGSIQGVVIHQDWIICYANPAMAKLLGYGSPEEILGQDLQDFILPDYLPELQERMRRCFDGEAIPAHHGWQLRCRDKKTIWVSSGANRIHWQSRPAIVAFLLDITVNKMAEEALRKSERRFRELFRYSPDAIFVETLDGVILDVNPAACQLYRMDEADLVGRKVDHIPNEHLDPTKQLRCAAYQQDYRLGKATNEFGTADAPHQVEALVENPSGPTSRQLSFPDLLEAKPVTFEQSCETFDGRVLPLEIRANLIEYNNQSAWLLLVRDVTDRKQLQEKLQQVEKMQAIGRVTRGVAHDFNNMLTAIGGYAQVLLANSSLADKVQCDIREILKAVEHARKLTHQLLAFRHAERQDIENLDFNQLIRDLATLFRRLLTDKIELRLDLDPLVGELQGPTQDFERLLVNLVMNARDAMPNGGQLVLSTSEVELNHPFGGMPEVLHPGSYVLLSVEDNGVGMTEEVRGRIFEPFFTTKGTRGTGLGLFNVYGIVNNCGGHINVRSRAGIGTTFQIYLPIRRVRSQPVASKSSIDSTHRGSDTTAIEKVAALGLSEKTRTNGHDDSCTILFVDDELPIRVVSTRVLQEEGFLVLSAENGLAALDVVQSHSGSIDLVVTDLVMPKMNGLDLVMKLKETYPNLPVLFIAGAHNPSTDETPLDAEFLAKPFLPQTMVNKVRELLSDSKARR